MFNISERFSFSGESEDFFLLKKDAKKTPDILIILRALSGTLNLKEEGSTREIELKDNFIKPGEDIEENNFSNLFDYLVEDPSEKEGLIDIMRRGEFSKRNKKFYMHLKNEIILSLFSYQVSNYTSSFLHLYRAVEYLSTACLLIYTSQEKSFESAFSFLKTMYADEKQAKELHILKKFLKFYYKGDSIYIPETVSFDLKNVEDSFQENIIEEWEQFIEPGVRKEFLDSDKKKKIEIDYYKGIIDFPFKEIASLVVFIRNKSFHYQIEKRNIQLFRLGGSERLFKFLMPGFLEWFSHLFIEIIKWEMKSM